MQSGSKDARGVRLLHSLLLAGQVALAGVFAVIVLIRGPLLDRAAHVGLALSIVAFAGMLAAGRLQARVSRRESHVEPDEYWSRADVQHAARLSWFVSEGATTTALLGYVLAGTTTAAVVALAAIGVFAWQRPARFETPGL